MDLKDVYSIPLTYRKKRKRIGRGQGSGTGKTSGRGHKGAKSRSGSGGRIWYEGGQMPLFRRIPKRGFNNKWRREFLIVNVEALEKHFEDGATITRDALIEKGLLKDPTLPFKVLGRGELSKKLTVEAHRFSKSAEEKITKAGGSVSKLKTKKEKAREKLTKLKREAGKRKKTLAEKWAEKAKKAQEAAEND